MDSSGDPPPLHAFLPAWKRWFLRPFGPLGWTLAFWGATLIVAPIGFAVWNRGQAAPEEIANFTAWGTTSLILGLGWMVVSAAVALVTTRRAAVLEARRAANLRHSYREASARLDEVEATVREQEEETAQRANDLRKGIAACKDRRSYGRQMLADIKREPPILMRVHGVDATLKKVVPWGNLKTWLIATIGSMPEDYRPQFGDDRFLFTVFAHCAPYVEDKLDRLDDVIRLMEEELQSL